MWNYFTDKVIGDPNRNNDVGNYKSNKNKTATSKSFHFKKKIIDKTPDSNSGLDREVVAP